MPIMKFPIRVMTLARCAFGPVLVGVLGSIALTHPTDAWRSVAVSVAALASFGMMIGALFGSSVRRPFLGGFALCCGGYFFLYWLTYGTGDNRQFPNPYLESAATTKALSYLHDALFPESSVKLHLSTYPTGLPFSSAGWGGGGFGGGGAFDVADDTAGNVRPPVELAQAMTMPSPQPPANQAAVAAQMTNDNDAAQSFLGIGQSLWALALGYAGGIFAQFLARRNGKTTDRPNPPASAAFEPSLV